jgi:transcriptional regulator with XRE-family HTH domain
VNVNYFPHPQDNASFATVNRRPQEIATMTSASKDAVLGRLEGVLLERKRAARARSDKPQSQKDLAAAARIHESRLSRVLSGELALRADEIVRLSEVLGVRAGWLQNRKSEATLARLARASRSPGYRPALLRVHHQAAEPKHARNPVAGGVLRDRVRVPVLIQPSLHLAAHRGVVVVLGQNQFCRDSSVAVKRDDPHHPARPRILSQSALHATYPRVS